MITYKTEKKTRKKKTEQFAKFYIICQIAKLYQYSIPIPKGLACIIIIWPCRQRKYSVQSIIILKIHLLLNEIAVRHSGVRHSRFAKKKTERKKIPPLLSCCVGGFRGKTQSQFSTLPMCQEETLSIQITYLAFIHYK